MYKDTYMKSYRSYIKEMVVAYNKQYAVVCLVNRSQKHRRNRRVYITL